MITKMFSIYDSKAAVFGVPFFMPKEQMALRAFSDLCNDKSSLAGMHPEDFSLFEIGEFDDEKGVSAATMHKPLGIGSSFIKFNLHSAEPDVIEDIQALKRKRDKVLVGNHIEEVK